MRYLELPGLIQPLAVKLPLKMLVMISSPSDHPLLDVEREWGTPVLYMRSPDGYLFEIERAPLSFPQRVSEGLAALTELMQTPGVRAAVVAFRTDFQAACEMWPTAWLLSPAMRCGPSNFVKRGRNCV